MTVEIKLSEGAVMPSCATEGAAAYDLYTSETFTLNPGRNIVPTGISIAMTRDYEALIDARSGFSAKGMEAVDDSGEVVRIDADVIQGKIDSDYRGTLGVIVKSYESKPYTIAKGTRIAQLSFLKVEHPAFVKVNELPASDRGEGGFGHTGTTTPSEPTQQAQEVRTYYANIVRTRGTAVAEICSFIFLTREDAENHRDSLTANRTFQFVETITFNSTKDYQ